MEFRILGPLEVSDGGEPIQLGGGKQRALLALLLLNANKTVSTDRLIDDLWGEHPPASAAKIVQNYVSRLRSAFQQATGSPDEILATHGSAYQLRLEPASTDLDRFEELLAAGREALVLGDAKEAAQTLREALSLWRGPALADFAFESFAQAEIARLEERRLVAVEERIEADLMLGRHRDLVGELESLIARHPLRERLRGQLMLALYRSGRQSEALHAYQQARATLVAELGLEPGPALQQLEKGILHQDRSLDLSELPSGAVTFLFSDIEASTLLLKKLRDRYPEVLAEHARLLRQAFEQHRGHEVGTQGDSLFVAFESAHAAVLAAVAAQRALSEHSWPDDEAVRVRIGIHTGQATVTADGYAGLSVHRAARIGAAGHGGQILISQATQNLFADEEEDASGIELADLGVHRLKDLDRPVHLYQVVAPELQRDFPPVRAVDTHPAASRASSGRRLVAIGALLVLAAAVGVLVLKLTRTEGGGLASVSGNTVGVIDPATDQVVAQIPVGRTPSSIAVGEGEVWLINADDQTIARIDPRTRRVEEFGTGTRPTDLAVGAGAVWVGNGVRPSPLVGHPVATSISKLDPSFGQVRQTIKLPRSTGPLSNLIEDHIAVGTGAVWAINPDFSVSRIDPESAAVTRALGVRASAVAADERSVWVLTIDNTLARLSPRTGKVEKLIEIAATALSDVALGAGSVWVAAPFDGVVWRVDPGARDVLRTIDVGFGVNRLAFGEGSLWTANSLRGTVSRVDANTNAVAKTITLGNTPRGLAAGRGSIWVTVAGAPEEPVAAAPSSDVAGVRTLPRSICGNVFYGGGVAPDYLIVSDLPLQGGEAFPTLQMSEAIAFTLRRRGFRAGKYRVAYQSCDDSTTASGIYDRSKCASNAKAYADDPHVLGVIGPFNSGCAEVAIPIANSAARGPLAIVSPANSVVGLTRKSPRAPRNALRQLYPTGKRNYVRVSPTEDSHSAAHAILARQLGVRRVYVLHDSDEQFGLQRAIFFRRAARRLGLEIVGFSGWDPQAAEYRSLARAVARARPDGVFLGGGLYSNGGRVIGELRAAHGPEVAILAPEFLPISALFEAGGSSVRGTYVSRLGLTIDRLPREGRRFLRDFAPIQPGGKVDVYAAYAAQATEVLLDAIAHSDGSRASVVKQLFSLQVRQGILGDFRFTPTGDTTQQPITILRAQTPGGAKKIQGYEGGVIDRVITPPPGLTR